MSKITLSHEQVFQLIKDNQYEVDRTRKFESRCIDGRYQNEGGLAPLSIMGADIGDLAILASTGNQYGFDVDLEKSQKELEKLVGGISHFSFHSDKHGDETSSLGCGYLNILKEDLAVFNLEKEQVSFLLKMGETVKEKGAFEVVQGNHHEGAFLQISGNYSIYPRYSVEMNGNEVVVEVFTFHRSLVNERHKAWVSQLVKSKAVTLYENLDEEYLYEVLSSTTEDHLFETARRIAKGLPLYEVSFDDSGDIKINDLGII